MLDSFGQDFLRLTLEIDKHIDGYIDAYYGPEALKAEVAAGPTLEPAALIAQVAALAERIPVADPGRAAYARASLRALDCTTRMLAGETFDYLDEVNRIYDISPEPVDEQTFLDAHNKLDTLLPGSGSIADRLQARRKRYEIDAAQALGLLELTRTETRRRTAALIDLPDDQGVAIELVQDQPWGAYNWYLGGGKSLIEFNTDIPLVVTGLLNTFAHEGYPGHHTESMLKEQTLYREKGYGEQAAMLLHSPAAVIAEGIATQAVELIFPDGEEYVWNVEVMLPAAGIEPFETAVQMRQIAEAGAALRYVSGNAAVLYHTGALDREQTLEYVQTYGLSTPERAAKSFSFFTHPLYRSYVFTYTQGYDLIERAAVRVDRRALFRRLLTEQVLPSELAALALSD